MYDILLIIQTIVVITLIGLILIQRSDSDGFGTGTGGGGNQFMTGRASANFLTRLTSGLAAGFIVLSLALAYIASGNNSGSLIDAVEEETAPAATVPLSDVDAPAPKADKKKPAGEQKPTEPVQVPKQ